MHTWRIEFRTSETSPPIKVSSGDRIRFLPSMNEHVFIEGKEYKVINVHYNYNKEFSTLYTIFLEEYIFGADVRGN